MASKTLKSFVCICVHCMDRRVNSNATHGMEVFKMSNAGASFPAPSELQSHHEDSLHILLERVEQSGEIVIAGFSGHADCVAVNSIWAVGDKPMNERSPRESSRYAPYENLVEQLRETPVIGAEQQRHMLTLAKVLQDINHALAYEDIHSVVDEDRLKLVAYFEDVTVQPHTLFIYDPVQDRFLPTTHRLKELCEDAKLLEHYALKTPVDVAQFISHNVSELVRAKMQTAAEEFVFGNPAEPEQVLSKADMAKLN